MQENVHLCVALAAKTTQNRTQQSREGFNFVSKISQRRHDIYLKSLEMGQTVPEHFFAEPKKAKTVSNLKNGILWSAVGLALLIYFIVEQENEAFIVGIVPAFVGVGYILVHFLDKPKKNDEQNG
ncbi:MAG: DUF6249 domain-containing protein [Paludibacter sp.]